jgi:hypothetical protein
MAIRTITTTAQLKPWLPSDYSATGWDDAQIQTALDGGNDPRLIAAEIWEEYAQSLPEETGANRQVQSWQNMDTSATYATGLSPRENAMAQARFHRRRSKVKQIQLARPALQADTDEGLFNPAPEE